MVVLVLVVAATILISSQCSLYEAVLYSTRMGTLEAERTDERRRLKARRMIEMKQKISAPLSAILILNTLANTAGATIAGMYAHKALGSAMVPLFSVVFTLGILFLAEIIPKTLGAIYWRRFWPSIIWPLTMMKYALYPAILVTQKMSEIIAGRESGPVITEEDILGTIRLGAKGGEITQQESLMLHNIIRLETIAVTEVMTPRTVMFVLNENLTAEEGFEAALEKGFTRVPVFRKDRENIVGYVMIHDLSVARVKRPKARLSDLMKPIPIVQEKQNCLALLTQFLATRRQIAVIWDEYGGVAGVVTLEDIVETLLGAEIVDENDAVVDLRKLARMRRQKRFMEEKGE
jgi:CBS domain containing-hemolysin-like protein